MRAGIEVDRDFDVLLLTGIFILCNSNIYGTATPRNRDRNRNPLFSLGVGYFLERIITVHECAWVMRDAMA